MRTKEKLESLAKNSIELKIDGKEQYKLGATRFGGQPDVPPDFVWPTFEGRGYDDVVKNRPLTFLAQFNCEELAQYDTEHLLPDHGLLSFFYEIDTQCWGYNPKDKGCAQVYWFEDTSVLSAADFPADMEANFKIPITCIQMKQKRSFPQWEDFYKTEPEMEPEQYIPQLDKFEEAQKELGIQESMNGSKLLGWSDMIQDSMPIDCELVTQGYYLGGGWEGIPEEVRRQAEETAIERWILLFQLDTVECSNFELMFGDCGRIYFYIPKEDLLVHRFDRVWLMLQCY